MLRDLRQECAFGCLSEESRRGANAFGQAWCVVTTVCDDLVGTETPRLAVSSAMLSTRRWPVVDGFVVEGVATVAMADEQYERAVNAGLPVWFSNAATQCDSDAAMIWDLVTVLASQAGNAGARLSDQMLDRDVVPVLCEVFRN